MVVLLFQISGVLWHSESLGSLVYQSPLYHCYWVHWSHHCTTVTGFIGHHWCTSVDTVQLVLVYCAMVITVAWYWPGSNVTWYLPGSNVTWYLLGSNVTWYWPGCNGVLVTTVPCWYWSIGHHHTLLILVYWSPSYSAETGLLVTIILCWYWFIGHHHTQLPPGDLIDYI